MKILDIGCHDGYVGAWLRQRATSLGRNVELYGMELHPGAAEKARERGYAQVVEDIGENAPAHFPPDTFDAVVMFELIEHVPDMDALLAAAETVLKPGGQVYVSTPDGCFGAGNNPHHLRALRSIDLADLLRRRGRLNDVAVGNDGVSIASYTPAPRKADIAIYCGPTHPWSPLDIGEKGLGGSETAAVRLANELSELGFVVTVYGEVSQGCFRDVVFRHWSVYDPLEQRLATIASRMPEIFDRPNGSRARLLWLHDVDCGDRLTPERAEKIDAVLTLSKWHRDHVVGRYPFLTATKLDTRPAHNGLGYHASIRPNGKVHQTRNGIHLPLFDGEQPERRKRVLFTSSPDRGLDLLLELWPRVLEAVPDAEFAHAYPPYFDQAADQIPGLAKFRDRLRELSDQPGVTNLGSLSQPALVEIMRSSLVWAHPSWCTPLDEPFHETSCIGAMEAQAGGLHVVASDWGALRETVMVGHLVAGPIEDRWRDSFVESIVAGLTDPTLHTQAQTAAPAVVGNMGWDGVAVQVARLVDDIASVAT